MNCVDKMGIVLMLKQVVRIGTTLLYKIKVQSSSSMALQPEVGQSLFLFGISSRRFS
jgi:hypothetical protein